jgi:ABC-2 type transport system permease protein
MTGRAARAVAGVAARDVLTQRAGLLTTAVFDLMVTAILAALWTAAVVAHGGPIAGYGTAALVWYVACSEAGTVPLPMRLIETIGDDIATDRYTTELLRPVSPLTLRVARELGAAAPRVAVCAVVGSAVATIAAGAPPDGRALALAAPSLLLAVSLNIVTQHAFAATTFWLHDAKTGWFLYQKLVFVLGGMLIPLELLPTWLERTAQVLPFAAMAYVPARLASGHVEPGLLVVQALWLAAALGAARRLYRVGERRLTHAVA